MLRGISRVIQFNILQDVPRLKTFSRPQQKPMQFVSDYSFTYRPAIDPQIFQEAALKKIIKISDGFREIEEHNPTQITSIEKHELLKLEVNTQKGLIRIEGFEELSTLYYYSPFNGIFKYYYSIEQDRFLNNKDEHILDECLTRQVLDKYKWVLSL